MTRDDTGATRTPLPTGATVSVRSAWPPGHIRTPAYIRGKSGQVVADLGRHPNPEELAYRRPGTPAPTLYRVRFSLSDVWPDYRGSVADTLDVEIYDHWLEDERRSGTPS